MIDTHAHLHVKVYDPDRPQVLARAWAAGLTAILEVNIDAGGWPSAQRLAVSDARVFLSVGIHPHDTGRTTAEETEQLLSQVKHPKVRAIGETGLDYYRNYAPHPVQREFFTRHVSAARETGLPLVVHVRAAAGDRSAHDDAVRILLQTGGGRVRGVFHCFSGDLDQAREAIALNFRLGVGGAISYDQVRSASLWPRIAGEFGPGVFLLETDCPYLTPHPHRRARNEPANIPIIAEVLAGYLGLTPEAIERFTDEGARELFRLP